MEEYDKTKKYKVGDRVMLDGLMLEYNELVGWAAVPAEEVNKEKALLKVSLIKSTLRMLFNMGFLKSKILSKFV